jgi:hypothetical protein
LGDLFLFCLLPNYSHEHTRSHSPPCPSPVSPGATTNPSLIWSWINSWNDNRIIELNGADKFNSHTSVKRIGYAVLNQSA